MIKRLTAALLFVALTACSSTAGSGGRHGWTIPGTIRIGEQQEPDSFNLMFGHSEADDIVDCLVFSHLLRFDDNGNYIPDLALQVPTTKNGGISADQKTITLHLRKDVKWSDGVPVTAHDWLFTYHTVMNPKVNVKTRYGWTGIASALAPDPYTLVIKLKRPDVSVLGVLTMGGAAYPPLPEHVLKNTDLNTASFNAKPVTDGPYVLQRWTRGAELVFAPNPDYFRGKPAVTVIWKVIPDSNTLLQQLRTHEIDVYPSVDVANVASLKTIDGITTMHRLIADWRHLGINMSRPTLRDVRVRRALAEGIDWKKINDTVYHGYNELASSDIFPQSWAAPTIPRYAYNPQHAQQLLHEAGWVPGTHLTISANNAARSNEQAELVMQQMLKPLGIELDIRNYPSNVMFAQNGPLYTGKYDIEWSVDTNGPDPDNSGSWHSQYIPPNGANTSWLSDPVIDQTSAAAAATFDQNKRKALYQREEERIHELVPTVFFYWETAYYGVNSDVVNYKPGAFLTDTWNAWEWKN